VVAKTAPFCLSGLLPPRGSKLKVSFKWRRQANSAHPTWLIAKSWIVCDNGASSHFLGHCYVRWESINTELLYVSTSTDGGLPWGPELNMPGLSLGIGGQSVVQPNGTVIMSLAPKLSKKRSGVSMSSISISNSRNRRGLGLPIGLSSVASAI
jgi:hypothetical protein